MNNRVQAVIFDWSGTTVDHGCFGLVASVSEVFRRRGVEIDARVVRSAPLGTTRRDHLVWLLRQPSIQHLWDLATGKYPTSADVDAMLSELADLPTACLLDHATPIDGVLDVVAQLRAIGVEIGSTTSYTRRMIDVLASESARQGYAPDCIVAADETPRARPYPDMALTAVMRLGVGAVRLCVKVGDTPADIAEGLAAGMWTVGVAVTGSEVGLSAEAWASLPAKVRAARAHDARQALRRAGAHYVVDSVAELLPVIDTIDARLAEGGRP
jgi:phosphonoacetaldehyde hydrolase